MRVSQAVGRYRELQELPLSVYWKYNAIKDGATRPSHLKLDGMVRHRDDPIWKRIYPPNAWNCRCFVTAHSKRECEKEGWKISDADEPLPKGYAPHPDWDYDVGEANNYVELWSEKLGDLKAPCKESNAKGRFCKEALYELAKKETVLNPNTLKDWFVTPSGDFRIATVEKGIVDALGAKSAAAYLSTQTLEKQKRKHPEIEWYEYLALHLLLERSDIGVKEGGEHFVAIRSFLDEDKYYMAAIKVTKSKETIFVTSFRRIKKEDIEKKIEKGELLWDKR